MVIVTRNPYTGEVMDEYEEFSEDTVLNIIGKLRDEQRYWKNDIDERIDYLSDTLKPSLMREKQKLAKLMSSEMGKPIAQSVAEIDKSIRLVDYAVENFKKFLENEYVETEAKKSYIRFDPIGVVYIIMPWNFPLWQVMRAAVPALAAGNAVMLKHASIVTGTSLKIEKIFNTPLFRSIVVRGSRAINFIKHVDAVSFTGSTSIGSKIAEEAGKHIKKHVLELGGSDPFIVLKSADIENAVRNAAFGRLQNYGQSCIASKRFIVHEDIFTDFHRALKEEFERTNIGDPLDEKTLLGPLSSEEQTKTVTGQIDDLKKLGDVEILGSPDGRIVPPTIAVTDRIYNEEVFGPVAILKKFKTQEDAVKLANETPFGLGASVWGDPEEAENMIPDIKSGMVFINKIVTSDPRLPFGGVKQSGIGRELSRYGLLEFTNIKSVWIQ